MSSTTTPAPAVESIVNFTFELGQLRMEARRGWRKLFVDEESVAEHTQRAACLGFILAKRLGYKNPAEVAAMVLFHDMQETRTSDVDRVGKMYLQVNSTKAAKDQTTPLGEVGQEIFDLWQAAGEADTEAGKIAKDAEILEMVFTARELVVRGHKDAQEWIDSSRPRLKNKISLEILEAVNIADPSTWWKQLYR